MIDFVLGKFSKNYALKKFNEDASIKKTVVNSYHFGMEGCISTIQVNKLFLKKEEINIVPLLNDAPAMFIVLQNKTMIIQVVDLTIEKGKKYPRFNDLEHNMDGDKKDLIVGVCKDYDEELLGKYLDLYLETIEDAPTCFMNTKRNVMFSFVEEHYSPKKEFSKEFFNKYIYFGIDTSIVNYDANEKIKSILKIMEANPDAQYMFVFKGRSIPATYGESYETKVGNDESYTSITMWDGNSGNMFDVDYRLVPEKLYIDGKQIDF